MRVLDFPAVSTHLLLALCARFAGLPKESGGLGKESDKAAIKATLQGCVKLPDKDLTFRLFIDSSCVWQPPLPLAGRRPVAMTVQAGVVDLAPLRDALADPEVHDCAESMALRDFVTRLPAQLCVAELLLEAVGFGAKAFTLKDGQRLTSRIINEVVLILVGGCFSQQGNRWQCHSLMFSVG